MFETPLADVRNVVECQLREYELHSKALESLAQAQSAITGELQSLALESSPNDQQHMPARNHGEAQPADVPSLCAYQGDEEYDNPEQALVSLHQAHVARNDRQVSLSTGKDLRSGCSLLSACTPCQPLQTFVDPIDSLESDKALEQPVWTLICRNRTAQRVWEIMSTPFGHAPTNFLIEQPSAVEARLFCEYMRRLAQDK